MMHRPVRALLALGCTLIATAAGAAVSGVQWTPDAKLILVSKDVGNERWAISFNLDDQTATGNVFFTDDRAPSFIFCDLLNFSFDAGVGELDLQYRCSGAERAFGGFSLSDWAVISDEVFLPMSFFVPEAETCDLRDALNGPNANNAGSFWNCTGNGDPFEFQIFGNGTGLSSLIGAFEFDAVEQACSFGRLADGSFLDVEYSPSRDLLTVYEITKDVDQVFVSECSRTDL